MKGEKSIQKAKKDGGGGKRGRLDDGMKITTVDNPARETGEKQK